LEHPTRNQELIRIGDAAGGGGNGNEEDELFSLLAPDIEAFLSYIPTLAPRISGILAAEVASLKALADTIVAPAETAHLTHGGNGQRGSRSTITRGFYSRASQKQQQRLGGPRAAGSIPKQHSSASATVHTTSDIPSLSAHLSKRLIALREAQLVTIPRAQQQVAETAARVLAAHTQVMERTVHILERTKHGALARAEKARAEHLAKVAEGMECKVKCVPDFLPVRFIGWTSELIRNYK
jgi:diphthamide biosynthesis protein 3